MSNMDDLEDLIDPEFDSEVDTMGWDEDYESNTITLYSKKLPEWKTETRLSYVPGQWNDSGVDPPSYFLSLEGYWVSFDFDETKFSYTNKDGKPKYFKIRSTMKLADFVTIVSSPFPLELSDGHMGRFYEDEFDRKNIVIEIDEDHVKQQIQKYIDLLVFS